MEEIAAGLHRRATPDKPHEFRKSTGCGFRHHARRPADPDDRHLFTSGAAHLNLRWSLSPQWGLTVRAMAESFQSDLRRHQPYTAPMQRDGRSASLGTQWELARE